MIESIHCKNFQSLKDVELVLGKFTVIVGPSSSGKSAVIRAIRAVADNALSSDNIQQGTRHASVAIKTDAATITIERSVGGSSVYKITGHSGEESSYTKLNRQVPSEVTAALGILPSTKEVDSISFAGQHDAPYLLTESSSNAARILGELTNVSTIFAAVQKATRKVKAASTLLNVRKKDQEAVMAQISEYRNINDEAKSMSQVELLWSDIEQLQSRTTLLERCLATAQTASDALRKAEIIPEAPSMDGILAQHKTVLQFKDLLKKTIIASKQIVEFSELINDAEANAAKAEEDLHNLLIEAGQCPLCLQEVKDI